MTCSCGNAFKLIESTVDGIQKWMCEKCGRAKLTNARGKEYLTGNVPKPKKQYLIEG